MTKFYNVLSRRIYKDAQGIEKKQYFHAGIIKETESGGRYMRMNHQPEVEFFIADQKLLDEALPEIDADK
jgi:hypothetical protein